MGYNASGSNGVFSCPPVETVAAAGSNQATAAALSANCPFHKVTGGNGAVGVILPVPVTNRDEGAQHLVLNSGTSTLLVFPDSGGALGTNAANASISIAAQAMATFICFSPVNGTNVSVWFGFETVAA